MRPRSMAVCMKMPLSRRALYHHGVGALLMAAALLLAVPAHAEMVVGTRSVGHGVTVWYTQNDTAPVVDIVLSFEGAGSVSDPEGKSGRAAFAAAMLTEGADILDSAAFRRALDENAIAMEMRADEDRLRIHVYALREHAVRAGQLLAMALAKPQLGQADQARMKADMLSLLARMNEQPSYHARRLLAQRGFKGHPYANAPYGDATSIAALSAQDVRDYLGTYVTRGNVLIAASGDVDASLLDDVLEPVVDALAKNDSGAVAATQTTLQGGGETVRKTMPAPQTSVMFAAPFVARDDARFYAAYLLNHILGGSGLISRLSDDLRQKKGLVYHVQTNLETKRGAAVMSGTLSTRNATADEAVAQVKAVLETLRVNGVTTQECADAKSGVIGSYARKLDGNQAVAEMLLAMQIHGLGEDYINAREALFNKVSCGEINALAEEFLNPSRFLFSVVGGTPDSGGSGPITPTTSSHSDIK